MASGNSALKCPSNAGELWDGFGDDQTTGMVAINTIVDRLLDVASPLQGQTAISAADEQEATFFGNLMIASHLHSSKDAHVTIVDSTNAFNVRALAHVVEHRSSASNDETVYETLERAKVVQTFDFQGVRECLDKVKADLQHTRSKHLLVFDRLSHSARILLKNNAVQGQAVLDAFFRTLKGLSVDHGVCSVFVDGFVQTRDSNHECVIETRDMQPFLDVTTAPSLDLHIHIHAMPVPTSSPRAPADLRVVEIATSRHDARARQWTQCEAKELRI